MAPNSWRASAYIIMIFFTVITIFPLIWLGYSSLKPNAEIVQHPLALPQAPSLDNYIRAWNLGGLGTALKNSLIYTCVATISTVLLSLAAAFAASGLVALTLVPMLTCLLYTSDAADDLLCVDLGGRRIIKKKTRGMREQREDCER